MNNKPVNLGIIGLGNWSREILLAVRQAPAAKVAGCYSRYPDTRISFAKEFDCYPYEKYEDMVADPKIEGVIVMSSNLAHEQDVTIAASGGKHIFITKPIATTVAAGKKIIDICAKNKVILGVGHQTRREPALRKLKEILGSGTLGEVRLVEANYSTANGLKIKQGDWRFSSSECPGGALIQIGIHVIDTLLYLLGSIKQVFSWHDRGGLKAEIAGVTATLLEFDSGLRGYLGSSYSTSFSHWIKIYGSKANAYFSELGGLTITNDSWEIGEVWKKIAPPAILTAPMPAIVEEIDEFARCIRNGGRPEIDGEAALHNLAVVLAAVESDKTGKPVEISTILGE